MNPRHFTWKFKLQMKRDEILNQCTRFRKCIQVWGGIFSSCKDCLKIEVAEKCLEPTSHSIFFFTTSPKIVLLISPSIYSKAIYHISYERAQKYFPEKDRLTFTKISVSRTKQKHTCRYMHSKNARVTFWEFKASDHEGRSISADWNDYM